MTLYEILSIVTPVLVIVFGSMMGYILKTITDSITKLDARVTHLEDKFDNRVSHLEKEIYFIKGLIEGKNLSK